MNILTLDTKMRTELIDITPQVEEIVRKSGVNSGFCVVYVPHTTAAVTINESADPSVVRDIVTRINKTVPFDNGYTHTEGNSAAHIKSSMLGVSLQVLIENGRLVLGTWQGIFFCEFDGPRRRKIYVKVFGE